MTTLSDLKSAADRAESDFDAACRPFYCDGRWGAYRACEYGPIPRAVESAMAHYIAATHAFYLARDGANGFLGGL